MNNIKKIIVSIFAFVIYALNPVFADTIGFADFKKIENNYRLDKLILSYTIHNSNIYYPYLRCLDLGKKQTIKEHNIEMDKICKKIKLEQ